MTEVVDGPGEPGVVEQKTFGLTAAQEEMWAAEQLQDDYSVTVAHYLDITDVVGEDGHPQGPAAAPSPRAR